MKIGITGGIGSGKSYICDMLKELGYPVYNCDDEAKRLMVENEDIIRNLRSLFGQDAYTEQHSADGKTTYVLNKPCIANYLFANFANASKVDAIVHPVVKADFKNWTTNQTTRHVFMECAILFESGFEDTVDKTVLIYADKDIRLQRAMNRDNVSEEKIRNRMKHQISDEEAKKRADYIFMHNDYETTEEEFKRFLQWLKQ